MGSLSDYSENKLLDLVLGAVAYTRPATVYIDLFTVAPNDAGAGGTVVPTSNGYPGRTAVTNNSTNFPAASGKSKSNGTDILIGTPTGGGWGTVVGFGLYDASSGGNFLGYYDLGTPKNCVAGKRVKILAGQMTLSTSGAWVAASLGNKVLDHLLGGPDYTPSATLYYGLLASATELTGNGYARIAVTNNTTNFPAASGGSKSNGVAVVFGPATPSAWTTATNFGLYDASSGGNKLMDSVLGASVTVNSGETATFDPGSLTASLS